MLFIDGWSVRQDEGLDNAACRILDELTGFKSIYLEQLYTYGDLDRDAEARVISIAYYALIKMEAMMRSLAKETMLNGYLLINCRL